MRVKPKSKKIAQKSSDFFLSVLLCGLCSTASCSSATNRFTSYLAALERLLIFRELLGIGARYSYAGTPGLVKVSVKLECLEEIAVALTTEVEGVFLTL